jgi:hypothetical protein
MCPRPRSVKGLEEENVKLKRLLADLGQCGAERSTWENGVARCGVGRCRASQE